MKISELRRRLGNIQKKHGDLNVFLKDWDEDRWGRPVWFPRSLSMKIDWWAEDCFCEEKKILLIQPGGFDEEFAD